MKKLKITAAIAIMWVLSASATDQGPCFAKGDYLTINGQQVFWCGTTNGTVICAYKCGNP